MRAWESAREEKGARGAKGRSSDTRHRREGGERGADKDRGWGSFSLSLLSSDPVLHFRSVNDTPIFKRNVAYSCSQGNGERKKRIAHKSEERRCQARRRESS